MRDRKRFETPIRISFWRKERVTIAPRSSRR